MADLSRYPEFNGQEDLTPAAERPSRQSHRYVHEEPQLRRKDRELLTPLDPLVGQVVEGRYRILRRIGRGGMGVVYLAEHVLLHKKVAIKTLAADAVDSQEAAERFLREAQAAAAVGNEHIVDVTDLGTLDSGILFYVLEYLDGMDLARKVATEGPLAVQAALMLLLQLCEALSAVHAAGIVHRDLKPANLFVVRRRGADFLKVLDFGICTSLKPTIHRHRLTPGGRILGTPEYMAPEQVEGKAVGPQADLYAIGAIGYFLLVGKPPLEASTLPGLFLAICDVAPEPIAALRPEVPQALSDALMRALSKAPDGRFADCAALRRALLRASPETPTLQRDRDKVLVDKDTERADTPTFVSTALAPTHRLTRSRHRFRNSRARWAAYSATMFLLSSWAVAARRNRPTPSVAQLEPVVVQRSHSNTEPVLEEAPGCENQAQCASTTVSPSDWDAHATIETTASTTAAMHSVEPPAVVRSRPSATGAPRSKPLVPRARSVAVAAPQHAHEPPRTAVTPEAEQIAAPPSVAPNDVKPAVEPNAGTNRAEPTVSPDVEPDMDTNERSDVGTDDTDADNAAKPHAPKPYQPSTRTLKNVF